MLKESLLGCHIGLLLVRDASCFACFYLVNVGTWECVWNFKLVHFVYTFGKVVLEMHKDICCLIVLCMIEASQLFTAVLRMFSEDEGFFFCIFWNGQQGLFPSNIFVLFPQYFPRLFKQQNPSKVPFMCALIACTVCSVFVCMFCVRSTMEISIMDRRPLLLQTEFKLNLLSFSRWHVADYAL